MNSTVDAIDAKKRLSLARVAYFIGSLLIGISIVSFYYAMQPTNAERIRSAVSGNACVQYGIGDVLNSETVLLNHHLSDIKERCQRIAAFRAAQPENAKLISDQRTALTK